MARAKRSAAVAGPVEEPWMLPIGWHWERLQNVAEVNPRTEFEFDDDASVVFLGMAALSEESGLVDVSKNRPASEVAKGFTKFRSGDVLFAKITPCMENGKIAVIPEMSSVVGAGSTEFHVLRSQILIPKFLFYFLVQRSVRQAARENMSGSAGQLRVPPDYLRLLPVPVPPPEAQERLVARIDDLFAEIDEGACALEAARNGIKTYRNAVLYSAATGDLTEDWRLSSSLGRTGSDLLEDILQKRRARWAARTKGGGRSYQEPVPPDLSGLPTLPQSWCWASLDQLCELITSGSRAWTPYYDRGDCVFVMAQNVRPGRYDDRFCQLVGPPEDDPERRRTQISRDDLLLTIVGANTGDLCRVNFDPINHFVCQSVALLRPIEPTTGGLAELLFAGTFGRGLQMDRQIYGAGRPHLSFDQIKSLAVPLPPLDEAHAILQRVGSLVEQVPDDPFDGIHPTELRQSILAAAFRGDLVT